VSKKRTKRILIVKVGSDERPAGPKDIKQVRKIIKKIIKGWDVIVTHHAIEFDFIKLPK